MQLKALLNNISDIKTTNRTVGRTTSESDLISERCNMQKTVRKQKLYQVKLHNKKGRKDFGKQTICITTVTRRPSYTAFFVPSMVLISIKRGQVSELLQNNICCNRMKVPTKRNWSMREYDYWMMVKLFFQGMRPRLNRWYNEGMDILIKRNELLAFELNRIPCANSWFN